MAPTDTKHPPNDEDEDPFAHVSPTDLFADRESPSTRSHPRRNWLPDFREQIDQGIKSYTLSAGDKSVTVDLEFRANSTGSDLWDASLVLANYLPSLGDRFFEGKSVIELGSGVGALGLLVRKFGATPVCLTDLSANLDLIGRNARLNGLDTEVQIVALDWTDHDPLPCPIDDQGGWDVILGSDLFLPFAPHLLGPLCRTLSKLLSPHSVAFVAYEKRFDCTPFFAEAERLGLRVDAIPDEGLDSMYRDPGRIVVLRIERKSGLNES